MDRLYITSFCPLDWTFISFICRKKFSKSWSLWKLFALLFSSACAVFCKSQICNGVWPCKIETEVQCSYIQAYLMYSICRDSYKAWIIHIIQTKLTLSVTKVSPSWSIYNQASSVVTIMTSRAHFTHCLTNFTGCELKYCLFRSM